MPKLIVSGWHTECGECGYGRGGPYGWGPEGPPHGVLGPDSKICVNPDCKVEFTKVEETYAHRIS
jgi:hypothetical protein